MHYRQWSVLALSWAVTLASPIIPSEPQVEAEPELDSRAPFPFSKIVAFGDDFTDDGSGSYAHGITGNIETGEGAHLWGADTWTDGPVAVTWMSKALNVPIAYNYAFGSSGGGNKIGSVCSNALLDQTKLDAYAKLLNQKVVPGTVQQIKNYTSKGKFRKEIDDTLHFLWTGNNDMIASLGWTGRFTICDKDTLCHPGQQKFITALTGCMKQSIETLIKKGAKHIVVPNVYPRHLTPWTTMYITGNQPGKIADFGGVITQTNAKLKTIIDDLNKQYKSNVMYYDAYGFLTRALKDPSMVQGAAYNNTCVDTCSIRIPGPLSNWDTFWQNTVIGKKPNDFFWMTTITPSSSVMKSIGNDMAAFVSSQF